MMATTAFASNVSKNVTSMVRGNEKELTINQENQSLILEQPVTVTSEGNFHYSHSSHSSHSSHRSHSSHYSSRLA